MWVVCGQPVECEQGRNRVFRSNQTLPIEVPKRLLRILDGAVDIPSNHDGIPFPDSILSILNKSDIPQSAEPVLIKDFFLRRLERLEFFPPGQRGLELLGRLVDVVCVGPQEFL